MDRQRDQTRRRKRPPREGTKMVAGPKPPHEGSTIVKGSITDRNLSEDQHPLLSPTDSEEDLISTPIEVTITEKKPVVPGEEAAWQIALQVFFPYIIAGLGMVAAGMLLDHVQHWSVFVKVSEIFILVPALLGLKGNLEMTLASRLSTQANIGNMDDRKEQLKMIGGNLALTQAQAVVVGFLAALAAMLLAWIPEGKFDIHHAFLLCASSVLTAALASLILGSVMIVVVLLSRKCKINPDNVATPIAASLGDLTTLALLSALANFFWNSLGSSKVWIAPTCLCICLVLTPLWCYISYKNQYVKEVLIHGWSPVIGAMMISSFGGLILDFAVATYHGIAVFQPVVNGVGGNLVAVQASRLSTALHQRGKPGVLPDDAVHGCPNPCTTFCGKASGRTTRVLLLMVIPGHLIFIYTISYMQAGHTTITPIFAGVYLTAAMLQVVILLYTANWLVHWLWKRGNDPDNFSIPYLTALGDLLGGALLAIAFHILYVVGDKDSDFV